MYFILSLAIGSFLSFGLIEILYSSSFIPLNFLCIISPLILSLILAFFYKYAKHTIIFPLTAIVAIIYSDICLTIQHINHIMIDNFSLTAVIYFIIAIIFSIGAFYVKQNLTFGIRTSATLKYEQVWNKTHRIFSLISCASTPFMYTLIFWYSGWTRFILLNIVFIIPIIISFFISHIISTPYINSEYLKQQTELEKQKKLEEEGKYK